MRGFCTLIIIRYRIRSVSYSLRICIRQYLIPFSYPGFPIPIPIPKKNMKMNMVELVSVRIRSVFIPSSNMLSASLSIRYDIYMPLPNTFD